MLSRRTVVRAVGAGLVGSAGLTYWQRRRILRHDDLASMERALEIESPTFDYGAAVSDDHLAASYERAVDVTEEAEAELGGADGQLLSPDEARHQEPAELEGAFEIDRRDALSTYLTWTRRSYEELGFHRYEEGRTDEANVADRVSEEEDRLEAIEYEYRGATITAAAVDGAVVDDHYRRAERALERATDSDLDGGAYYRHVWGRLGHAETNRHDADWFARALEGEAYHDRIETGVEAVSDAIEAEIEAVDFEHDEADWNYAESVVISQRLYGNRPYAHESTGADDSLANSLVNAAIMHVHAGSLSALTEIPGNHHWADLGWATDPGALPGRKRDAVEAIDRVFEEHGDDPLARVLLAEAVDPLEWGDRGLERGLEDVREDDDDEWTRRHNLASVRYLRAEAIAVAVPETVALVLEYE